MRDRRAGMTLIELVVAMALLVTLLAMSFGVIGAFYRESALQMQQSALQQNFRFAVDSLTNDMREATVIVHPGAPGNLVMSESLTFSRSGGDVTYQAASTGNGLYHLVRIVGGQSEDVTEDMPELVKIYFVYSGNKIYVMMVGKTTSYGKDTLVSVVSLVYARNLGEE